VPLAVGTLSQKGLEALAELHGLAWFLSASVLWDALEADVYDLTKEPTR
jgi:hypothetical protein